ncbi:MAG: AAA family ATPase [Deltaproteobacteria bacterium]|nr:AAA family ATPase [Deltaproteobacteria bacterium]
MDRVTKLITGYYLKNLVSVSLPFNMYDHMINVWLNRYAAYFFKKNFNELIEERLERLEKSRRGRRKGEIDLAGNVAKELKWRLFKEEVLALDVPGDLSGLSRHVVLGDKIAKAFDLFGAERELVRLFVLRYHLEPLGDLTSWSCDDSMIERFDVNDEFRTVVAGLTGLSEGGVESALREGSALVNKGLLYYPNPESAQITRAFKTMIASHDSFHGDVKRVVLAKSEGAELKKEDFRHLGEDFDFLANLLSAALRKRAKGVNVLLYGAPGVGKTEVAKTLARELNSTLYLVSEKRDHFWKGPRLTEVNMAQTLVQNEKGAILMFDEAEDIFAGPERSSRMVLNRLLEKNAVPVIWVTNHVEAFDKAALRRFSFAYEMTTPSTQTMRLIWEKELRKSDLFVGDAELEKIVSNYPLPPSYAASAVKAASITEDNGAIVRTLDSLEYAVTKKRAFPDFGERLAFNFELINTDLNLKALSDCILGKGVTNFSLCLYGPPGSGKSAYVRALANMIGKKVFERKGSDLLSKFAGQTEKEIAKSFREAEKRGEFLVFDEADSFLRERSLAKRSWEISHVNEMLTWMENHPLPFACSSNLMENLDKASLRRFTFKVKFDYLTLEQVRKAYLYFFGLDRPLKALTLTAADFALALKKAYILDISDPREIDGLILSEARTKGHVSRKIGF